MSAAQIAKLEALLAKVKRNAALPRVAARPAAESTPLDATVSAASDEPPAASPIEAPAWDDQTLAAAEAPPRGEPAALVPEPVSQVRAAELPIEDDTSDVDVLLADDIVDITEEEVAEVEEAAPEPAAEAPAEPPLSSRRLIAEAATGAEREAPLKTPPPESGRQIAAIPAMPAPSTPVVTEADDLEADLGPAAAAALPPPRRPMPTLEQLGETVDLEEATGADIEVEMPAPEAAPSVDDLELDLRTGAHSQYDDSLPPPPGAREELAAHLQREAERSAPPPPPSHPPAPEPPRAIAPTPPRVAIASAPPAAPAMPTVPAAAAVAAAVARAEAALVTAPDAVLPRPSPAPAAVEIVERDGPSLPRSFLELLDASLALGAGDEG
ncbi:MAG: hypothetical protein IT376_06035 [Polyangiaceae bacterium]|nr:hypothetical protein [Polyangiaceae bacterium]